MHCTANENVSSTCWQILRSIFNLQCVPSSHLQLLLFVAAAFVARNTCGTLSGSPAFLYFQTELRRRKVNWSKWLELDLTRIEIVFSPKCDLTLTRIKNSHPSKNQIKKYPKASVDALAVCRRKKKSLTHSLTGTFNSRDASASKNSHPSMMVKLPLPHLLE